MRISAITRLVLFSHDGEQRPVIFHSAQLNIVVGRNSTGKSTIIEAIDYVMGSSSCMIPSEVRAACSWIGVEWAGDSGRLAIARRMPDADGEAPHDYWVRFGVDAQLPMVGALPSRMTNQRGMLSVFERMLGLDGLKPDRWADGTTTGRVTGRHVFPFLLVDDSVVVHKRIALRGADGEQRRSIVDTLPFFLGAVDLHVLETLSRLKRLLRDRERVVRQLERIERDEIDELRRAQTIIAEARHAGIPVGAAATTTVDSAHAVLSEVAHWTPEMPSELPLGEIEQFQHQEEVLRLDLQRARRLLREARETVDIADTYEETLGMLEGRLGAYRLYPGIEVPDGCPVCAAPVQNVGLRLRAIQASFQRVRAEGGGLAAGKHDLATVVESRQADVEKLSDELSGVRTTISALMRQDALTEDRVHLDALRSRVAGRASLLLETAAENLMEPESERLRAIDDAIQAIGIDDSREFLASRMGDVRFALSDQVSKVLGELEVLPVLRGVRADLNPADLTIGVYRSARRMTMQEVGGDRNYLALHIALSVGLHRHFQSIGSPVPGVLVFDQVSRPFSLRAASGQLIEEHDDDVSAVLSTLDFFCREAEGSGIQIIVLEHARIAKSKMFEEALREFWTGSEDGLVPAHWRRVGSDGMNSG